MIRPLLVENESTIDNNRWQHPSVGPLDSAIYNEHTAYKILGKKNLIPTDCHCIQKP